MSLFSSERVIEQKQYTELMPGDIFIVEQSGIDDDPVALVKIRCRDDEDFTGTWIEFSELDMMR